MSKYLISYDLNDGEDSDAYDEIIEYLESFPEHAKALYSQWVVESSKTSSEIRSELKNIVDDNDVILVVKVESGWASFNLPKEAVDVLKQ